MVQADLICWNYVHRPPPRFKPPPRKTGRPNWDSTKAIRQRRRRTGFTFSQIEQCKRWERSDQRAQYLRDREARRIRDKREKEKRQLDTSDSNAPEISPSQPLLSKFFAKHATHLKEKQEEIGIGNNMAKPNNSNINKWDTILSDSRDEAGVEIIDLCDYDFDSNTGFNAIEDGGDGDVYFLELYQDVFDATSQGEMLDYCAEATSNVDDNRVWHVNTKSVPDFSVNLNDELTLDDCFDNVSEIDAGSPFIPDMQIIFDGLCNPDEDLAHAQSISNMIFNKSVVDANSGYCSRDRRLSSKQPSPLSHPSLVSPRTRADIAKKRPRTVCREISSGSPILQESAEDVLAIISTQVLKEMEFDDETNTVEPKDLEYLDKSFSSLDLSETDLLEIAI